MASNQDKARKDLTLPEVIETLEALEDILTQPSAALVEFIHTLESPLVVLGAGGKMGPTLAVLARRAAQAAGRSLEVIAASRFADQGKRVWLEECGVKTWSCDLLERDAVARLPDSANLVYMAGLKFGTSQNPALTWAVNAIAPALTAERYPHSRIVALSTGNVYPLTPVKQGGSVETDALSPLGEYASAAVGRERLFEYYSSRQGTRLVLVRLNYAVELRYGVLLDIALRVNSGQPLDVTQGHFNCIWQRDANDLVLRALAHASTPPLPLNLTGPEILAVRQVAATFGELLAKPVRFAGTEAETALLSNPAKAVTLLGAPPTPSDQVIRWIAHWVKRGGTTHGLPTHFEARDGAF
jgi:dTDP-4-dehydrorhamnose reductase